MALIFAIGLGSTPADLVYLWRRPGQLALSLLAMYVAVPVAAVLAAKALPLPIAVKTAILVLAISAGPGAMFVFTVPTAVHAVAGSAPRSPGPGLTGLAQSDLLTLR